MHTHTHIHAQCVLHTHIHMHIHIHIHIHTRQWNKGIGIAKKIWPEFEYIAMITTGAMQHSSNVSLPFSRQLYSLGGLGMY